MNDEHDNAQTDNEIVRRYLSGEITHTEAWAELMTKQREQYWHQPHGSSSGHPRTRCSIQHCGKEAAPSLVVSNSEREMFQVVGEGSYDPATDKLSMRPVHTHDDEGYEACYACSGMGSTPRMGLVQTILRDDTSDEVIVDQIIEVLGYERLEIITDMLEDRLLQVNEKAIAEERQAMSPAEWQEIIERRKQILRKFAPPGPSGSSENAVQPPATAGNATYCPRCACSGVGVCDDFPNCPAGRPGYHGEGELADFDPSTGRSSQDDWGRD